MPLCGKSLDMLWIAAAGQRVLGVELSRIAVRDFFAENNLPTEQPRHGTSHGGPGGIVSWRSSKIEIICGDFFRLSANELKGVTGVYDRAALISMPTEMRGRYIQHLIDITPPMAPILLVTLEFDNSVKPGPPFSVDEAAVRSGFERQYYVDCLDVQDILSKSPRFRESGISSLLEKVYRLRPK